MGLLSQAPIPYAHKQGQSAQGAKSQKGGFLQMEQNVKFCPLMKIECIEERCGWFSTYTDNCALVGITYAVEELMQAVKGDGHE